MGSTAVPFGAPMRELFLFDKDFRNLNHGSFGTYPRPVRDAFRRFQEAAEARPDQFIRYDTPKALDESRAAVARVLNVSRNEIVFVKNATSGINTVLRNLTYNPGDVAIYFATIYGAIEKTLVSIGEATPLKARKVEYEFPISHEELVRRFVDTVRAVKKEEGLNVRLAVFDTIVSMPGVRFPFEKLIEVCREEGILSVVDGAHGIGQIPLDLGKLQPDFFTSNCHKWLYVPRGCAALYVPRRHQHLIRTTFPTSWGFIPHPSSAKTARSIVAQPPKDGEEPKTPFEFLFEFVATADDTAYFSVPAALKFRDEICGGDEAIYTYLENLAIEAGDLVAAALGTEVLQEPNLQKGDVSELRRCAMSTVRLPLAVVADVEAEGEKAQYKPLTPDEVPETVTWMQDTMVEKYKTFVPVFQHGRWLWTRLSAQIYLDREDFEWLAGVLKELCDQVGNRKTKTTDLPVRGKT